MFSNFFFKQKDLGLVGLAAALTLFFGLWLQAGGFLDLEAYAFLYNYLDDRTLLSKVFDLNKNDYHCYQARELSYFVDLIDAHWIALWTWLGKPHFFALTHYLGIFSIALLHYYWTTKYFPRFSKLHVLLLVMLYLSSPTSSLASYFRSSKILVGMGLFLCTWIAFYFRAQIDGSRIPLSKEKIWGSLLSAPAKPWGLVGLYGIALLMTLAGRQGFFFALALSLLSLTCLVVFQRKCDFWNAVVFAMAALSNVIYNLWIGPLLIETIAGYPPDFQFQNLSFLLSFKDLSLRTLVARILKSYWVIPEIFSYFYGGLHGVVGLISIHFIVLAIALPTKTPSSRLVVLPFLAALVLLIVLNLVMVLRVPYLLWPEHKVVYYWLPTNVWILMASTFAIFRVGESKWLSPHLVTVLLAVLFVSNLVQLPGHLQTYKRQGSEFYQANLVAPALLDCIREGKTASQGRVVLGEREFKMCRHLLSFREHDSLFSSMPPRKDLR